MTSPDSGEGAEALAEFKARRHLEEQTDDAAAARIAAATIGATWLSLSAIVVAHKGWDGMPTVARLLIELISGVLLRVLSLGAGCWAADRVWELHCSLRARIRLHRAVKDLDAVPRSGADQETSEGS